MVESSSKFGMTESQELELQSFAFTPSHPLDLFGRILGGTTCRVALFFLLCLTPCYQSRHLSHHRAYCPRCSIIETKMFSFSMKVVPFEESCVQTAVASTSPETPCGPSVASWPVVSLTHTEDQSHPASLTTYPMSPVLTRQSRIRGSTEMRHLLHNSRGSMLMPTGLDPPGLSTPQAVHN